MILVDTSPRRFGNTGSSKFRFTYTRKLAAGLSKYLLTANALDTISGKGIELQLNVPESFTYDFIGMATSDKGYTLMTLSMSKCFWSDSYEDALVSEKKEIASDWFFVRFLESESADYIISEEKTLLGDTNYTVNHIFSHNDVAYTIEVSSFLLENVYTMIEALKNKKILK